MNRTIVMVHAALMGAWEWDNYRKFFEEKGYTVITPTLRYHDIDPKRRPDPRLGLVGLLDYAQDLEVEIQKLGIRPVLFGHSLGGLLVQILASRGLCEGAVLITPVPPRGIMIFKYSGLRVLMELMKVWGWWRKPFRLSFESISYAVLHLLPPREQREIYDKMVSESGRAFLEIGGFLDYNRSSKVDDNMVTCPMLVIAGAEDRAISPPVVKKISEKYKNVSTFVEFEYHSHGIPLEPGWERIAEHIETWIQENIK